MRLRAIAMAAALTICAAGPAEATIDITVAEVGSDVVFSYAGALDLSGATVELGNAQAFVFPLGSSGVGAIGFGGGSVDRIRDVTSFPAFGTGGFVAGSETTGPGFAVFNSDSIGVPFGYTSSRQPDHRRREHRVARSDQRGLPVGESAVRGFRPPYRSRAHCGPASGCRTRGTRIAPARVALTRTRLRSFDRPRLR